PSERPDLALSYEPPRTLEIAGGDYRYLRPVGRGRQNARAAGIGHGEEHRALRALRGGRWNVAGRRRRRHHRRRPRSGNPKPLRRIDPMRIGDDIAVYPEDLRPAERVRQVKL